jgi:hypothetical protein
VNFRRILLAALATAAIVPGARSLAAQCIDGSPAPCREASRRPPDPKRIAVLPFRVSTADIELHWLRDGLAELVATAFNGDVGPAAIEPTAVLSAQKRVGPGVEPSSPDAARRIAREVSAGQALYSSIVGTPRRFTVTASILSTGGGVLVPPVQVSGTADSIPALVSALTANLLGRSTGVPVTVSNEAATAYVKGMAAYRRTGGAWRADSHFTRAAQLDSTFVLPIFRIALNRAQFFTQTPVDSTLYRRLWSGRQKLSADQRLLLEALADSTRVLFRTAQLPRMERAVQVLTESAEAWNTVGQLYRSVGAAAGREDWVIRARNALQRALALDTALAPFARNQLADLAFLRRDAREFARYTDGSPWQNYLAAILRGNAAPIRTARRAYASVGIPTAIPQWLSGVTLPQHESDSILMLWEAVANADEQRRSLALNTMEASWRGGRPERAAAALRAITRDTYWVFNEPVSRAEYDSLAVTRFRSQVGTLDEPARRRACEPGLMLLRHGDTVGVRAIADVQPTLNVHAGIAEATGAIPRGTPGRSILCGEVIRAVLASMTTLSEVPLHRADTIMRWNPLNSAFELNYDLATAFARLGNFGAAASAVRRTSWGFGITQANQPRRVIALRQEGRWAALAGDTASAIQAYEHYLLWRANPEPSMIPQRDSVRAELAALRRGTRR